MTELETLKRAKMYMDKLANGINPLDDTVIPETDLINNIRLARCFFFVSDILRKVIENDGITPASKVNKPQKIPFSLSFGQRDRFVFSNNPIPVSEIVRRLNELVDNENMGKISYKVITTWLIEIGMLSIAALPSGKDAKRPTAEGNRLGITVEEREGTNGSYQVVVYNTQAQHFILDNLDAILEADTAKTKLKGKPWGPTHDACLKDLYQKGVPISEIAITLKRNTGGIRARLKKLGLIQKESDA